MELVNNNITIPVSIISLADVSSLVRELESIDNFFLQVKARRPGETISLPKTTKSMDELLQYNKLSLLQEKDRQKLKILLMTIRTKAPSLHISFSAEPSQAFMEKIIAWFRQEVNPYIVLQVGLQPNIGAGFTLRSSNHFFDFSLRQYMDNSKHVLMDSLFKVIDL